MDRCASYTRRHRTSRESETHLGGKAEWVAKPFFSSREGESTTDLGITRRLLPPRIFPPSPLSGKSTDSDSGPCAYSRGETRFFVYQRANLLLHRRVMIPNFQFCFRSELRSLWTTCTKNSHFSDPFVPRKARVGTGVLTWFLFFA